jgi:hypothetical protein
MGGAYGMQAVEKKFLHFLFRKCERREPFKVLGRDGNAIFKLS